MTAPDRYDRPDPCPDCGEPACRCDDDWPEDDRGDPADEWDDPADLHDELRQRVVGDFRVRAADLWMPPSDPPAGGTGIPGSSPANAVGWGQAEGEAL